MFNNVFVLRYTLLTFQIIVIALYISMIIHELYEQLLV